MSSIKHCQVYDYAAQNTSFKQAQQQPARNQARKVRYETHAHAHHPPGSDETWEIDPSAEFLNEQVRRNVNEDVRDVKDEQRNIEGRPCCDAQVGGEARNARVADVGAVDEGEEPNSKEPREDMEVEFAVQSRVEDGIFDEIVDILYTGSLQLDCMVGIERLFVV